MCGIAGFATLSKTGCEIDQLLLHKMQEQLIHRGPDGFGLWKSDFHGVGLAHRRLKIIDLTDAASQPMQDRFETVIISFNGEIYNHISLRKILESKGYQYFSNSDTETILYAYIEWGVHCLEKLDGEFAVIIFDIKKNELFLFRDRFGVKPIYFSVLGGFLSFASEIKALFVLPWISKNISQLGLYHYLTFMASPAPFTTYAGIYKLPAGFYAKLDSEKSLTFQEWYSPLNIFSKQETNFSFDENKLVEDIRFLLTESVKKRMISDVPVGVFLSGGIDSTLNVALMSKFCSKVNTCTVGFSCNYENNEFSYARKVAKIFGTNHHEIIISEKDAFDFFEKMLFFHDEPLADCVSIPLYYVAKCAKDAGLTVVQIGEGADELFFGYDYYRKHFVLNKFLSKKIYNLIPRFAKKSLANIFSFLFSKKQDMSEIFINWSQHRPTFWSGAIAFSESKKRNFLKNYFVTNESDSIVQLIYPALKQNFDSVSIIDYHFKNLIESFPNPDFGQVVLYLELKQRLPELLLMRADKMTMATSIEGRVPFLDYKLVEYLMRIPIKTKFQKNITKYLLKKACIGLIPDEIIYRKKVGFGAPTDRWLNSGEYFPNYFQNQISNFSKNKNLSWTTSLVEKNNTSVQLWTLQNLSILKDF